MSTTTSNLTSTADLLAQIMALAPTERYALRKAWDALDGKPPSYPIEVEPDTATETEFEFDREKYKQWLADCAKLSPRDQFAQLEDAIAQETDESALQQLQKALSELKLQHPALTVELALRAYAYEHPYMSIFAMAGVGFLLYRLCRWILLLIF